MKLGNRRAFTLIELLTVMAIIGLLIAILTPPLSRAREMARRSLCLTNLHAIGRGCITYATGSIGHFPYAAGQAPGFNAIGDFWNWDATSKCDFNGTTMDPVNGPFPKSNSRHLWKLVEIQAGDTKTFVCPSDSDGGDPFNPAVIKPQDPTNKGLSSISDVQNRSQFSYAYQYQGPALESDGTTIRTGWNTTVKDDPKLVILADASPAFLAKNPEAVVSTDDHTFELAGSTSTVGTALYKYWNALNTISGIAWDPTTAKAKYVLGRTDDRALLNSPNHRGDGQNIIRLDGSGDFATDPWGGAYMDNMWTVQEPTSYDDTSATAGTSLLVGRMQGVFNNSAAGSETTLMKDWVLHRESIITYPDSFLVP